MPHSVQRSVFCGSVDDADTAAALACCGARLAFRCQLNPHETSVATIRRPQDKALG